MVCDGKLERTADCIDKIAQKLYDRLYDMGADMPEWLTEKQFRALEKAIDQLYAYMFCWDEDGSELRQLANKLDKETAKALKKGRKS